MRPPPQSPNISLHWRNNDSTHTGSHFSAQQSSGRSPSSSSSSPSSSRYGLSSQRPACARSHSPSGLCGSTTRIPKCLRLSLRRRPCCSPYSPVCSCLPLSPLLPPRFPLLWITYSKRRTCSLYKTAILNALRLRLGLGLGRPTSLFVMSNGLRIANRGLIYHFLRPKWTAAAALSAVLLAAQTAGYVRRGYQMPGGRCVHPADPVGAMVECIDEQMNRWAAVLTPHPMETTAKLFGVGVNVSSSTWDLEARLGDGLFRFIRTRTHPLSLCGIGRLT